MALSKNEEEITSLQIQQDLTVLLLIKAQLVNNGVVGGGVRSLAMCDCSLLLHAIVPLFVATDRPPTQLNNMSYRLY